MTKQLNKEIASYQVCKMLLGLGYDETVIDSYNDEQELNDRYNISVPERPNDNDIRKAFELTNYSMSLDSISRGWVAAPTWNQVLTWLRDTHNIHVYVMWMVSTRKWRPIISSIGETSNAKWPAMDTDTYEEAIDAGIKAVLNMLQEEDIKAGQWDVISPDGFSIDAVATYSSEEEAIAAFNAWKKRFEAQGYYSSNRGRIALDELASHCKIIELI